MGRGRTGNWPAEQTSGTAALPTPGRHEDVAYPAAIQHGNRRMIMTKKKDDNDNSTVVNIASPGSVVGIQGHDVSGSTVVVDGSVVSSGGGRWLDDPADMDRSLICHADDL
jgi:hypothetical protein